MANKKKIVFWDIETSLSVMASFTLYPEAIPTENILTDWHIICASWKELGDPKVHIVSVLDNNNKDLNNDLHVVKKLAEVAKDADIMVAHNGDKFDVRKLQARLMYHNLDPLPPILTIDTCKAIRKVADFTSASLAYLGPHLGIGEKKTTSKGLWVRILAGDRAAIKEMMEYNKVDTVLLEKLYLRTRKYYQDSPNLSSELGISCSTCTSSKVQSRGFSITKAGLKYKRYQCQSCGAWFKSRRAVSKADKHDS